MNRSDAFTGALVADAATMGLHWMYDQAVLEQTAAAGDVLFRQPDAALYEGQKAYFAHATRNAGQWSQYGENTNLVANVIKDNGSYSVKAHQAAFMSLFGPGGSYIGYADRPTKALVAKLLIETDKVNPASGSDDDQLPALTSVPALFTHQAEDQNILDTVSNAVRVTSDNQFAIDGARCVMNCLRAIDDGKPLTEALGLAASSAGETLTPLLQQALAMDRYQPLQCAQRFGLPCHINQGLPVVWHLLAHGSDFESTVRDNILCGGDNCGRAIPLGAIAGLVFGVPESMHSRMSNIIV